MSGLCENYVPQWLYLTEFMDALGNADEADKQEAVLLLIRDRLIFDGRIDEKHFRFLSGKPSIVDATWLANLSGESVDWLQSCILAPSEPGKAAYEGAEAWFLLEIAVSALSLFRSRTPPGSTAPEPKRLKQPTETAKRTAFRDVYSEARAAHCKAPNVNEAIVIAREKLKARGYYASGLREIAEEPEFKALRGPVGVRVT